MLDSSRAFIYVCGSFAGSTIDLGGATLTNAGAPGTSDAFVAKYDTAGVLIWAQRFGGAGNERMVKIITDKDNNLYVGGYFSSNSFILGSTTLSPGGNEDAFLSRLDATGNPLWAKKIHCPGGSASIVNIQYLKGSQQITMMGSFQGTGALVTEGNTVAKDAISPQTKYQLKYQPGGTWVSARALGGHDPALGPLAKLVEDESQNIYEAAENFNKRGPANNLIWQTPVFVNPFSPFPITFQKGMDLSLDSMGTAQCFGGYRFYRQLSQQYMGDDYFRTISAGGLISPLSLSGYSSSFASAHFGQIRATGAISPGNAYILMQTVPAESATPFIFTNNKKASVYVMNNQQAVCAMGTKTGPLSSIDTCFSFGESIAVDNRDNYYVAGWYYRNPMPFYAGTNDAASITLPVINASNSQLFIARYKDLPTSLKANAGRDTTLCTGNQVQLGGVPAVSGGTAPFTYSWTPSAGLNNTGIPNPVANPTISTSYILTVVDALGVIARDTVNINIISAASVPVIQASGPVNFCLGDSVRLSAPAALSYLWNTGATTQSIVVKTSGSYFVTIVIAGTGSNCTSQPSNPVNVSVTSVTAPLILNQGASSFCIGGSTTLSSTMGSGGYKWSTGATTQNIEVTSTGTFTVQIYSSNGCISPPSAPVTITVNPLPATPIIQPSGPFSNLCPGDSITLTASTASGVRYLWSTGETTRSIKVRASGGFSVREIDSFTLCSSPPSEVFAVTFQAAQPVPVVTPTGPISFCLGDSATLTCNSGTTGSYRWSNGATTPSIKVFNTGNYSVQTTNPSGCLSPRSNTVQVTTVTVAVPTLTPSGPLVFCAGDSVILSAPAGFNYLWSNGSSSQNIIVKNSGNYSVTVTNGLGCSAISAVLAVTVGPLPPIPTISQNGNILTSSAGSGNQWLLNDAPIPGAVNNTLTVTQNGNYKVRVTVNGCQSISAGLNVNINSVVYLNNEKFEYHIYPNPSSGRFILQYKLPSSKKVAVCLMNELGQTVQTLARSQRQSAGTYTLSTGNNKLAVGIYILKIQVENNSIVQRIVVSR